MQFMSACIYKTILFLLFLVVSQSVTADEVSFSQFLESDETSQQTIDYGLLSELYKKTVIDLGPSNRKKSPDAMTMMGTGLKTYRNRRTFFEGARVAFAELKKEKNHTTLHMLRVKLQRFPDVVALHSLTKNEQTAYWLNLYNLALIEKLVKLSNWRMQDKLYKPNSILNEKFIAVMDMDLSLNDIQYNIVYKLNEPASPLLMYGFFQGVIGSPKMLKEAFTGQDLYKQLTDNAVDFINSNRGTQWRKTMRASWYYEHNQILFPDFQNDLKSHLQEYLSEPMKAKLIAANEVHTVLTSFSRADFKGGERMKGLGHNIFEYRPMGPRADLQIERVKRHLAGQPNVYIIDLPNAEDVIDEDVKKE